MVQFDYIVSSSFLLLLVRHLLLLAMHLFLVAAVLGPIFNSPAILT